MQDFDYYSVMEKRIKYLAKKYDPSNKFLPEWEVKSEMCLDNPLIEPVKKKRVARKFSEVLHAVITFLF